MTFTSHLQTLMALFPKSKVLKGQVSCSDNYKCIGNDAFGDVKSRDTLNSQ